MMLMPSHSERVTFGYIKLNLPIGFQISKAGEVFSACSYEHSLFAKKIGTKMHELVIVYAANSKHTRLSYTVLRAYMCRKMLYSR